MPAKCCREFYDRLCEDEPIFTLAGRDRLAPAVIAYWIKLATMAGVNGDKLNRAYEHLTKMNEFQILNPERTKMPD